MFKCCFTYLRFVGTDGKIAWSNTLTLQYARKSANQRKISHNKFVVGENDSSDSSDDEGNRTTHVSHLEAVT